MSCIAGIWNLKGEPIKFRQLKNMSDAMKYHSRDGSNIWQNGAIGLVHGHFWTTPEDVGELQPICSPDGRYWIVADARIDNRDEIIPLLINKDQLCKQVPTDAELILAAFAYWGEECPKKILGDFAFVIWDKKENCLFCARDVIGIRQFYYTFLGGIFYFATTISAIKEGTGYEFLINRPLIEDFLHREYKFWVSQTIYDGVYRLPPAHILKIDNNIIKESLYYVFGQEKKYNFRLEQDWIEAFREKFALAVRSRMRSNTSIGIAVSGGLDSSSVACVAHQLRQDYLYLSEIRLYSVVFNNIREADERNYFEIVAKHCTETSAIRIPGDELWAFKEFGDDNGFPQDEPDSYPLRSHTLAPMRASANDGCRVFLTGDSGDQVMGADMYFDPLFLRGMPLHQLVTEWQHFLPCGHAWINLLCRAYCKPLIPSKLEAWLRNFRSVSQTNAWLNQSSPDKKVLNIDKYYLKPPYLKPSAEVLYASIRSDYNIVRYSNLDLASAYCGVEWRTPYLDRELIEFMLNVPQHLLAAKGVQRVLLRKGMQNILPEEIRNRIDKAYFDELLFLGIQKESARLDELLTNSLIERLGFVDVNKLRLALKSLQCINPPNTGRQLLATQSLLFEAWLRRNHG